jgi:hypothetical protein
VSATGFGTAVAGVGLRAWPPVRDLTDSAAGQLIGLTLVAIAVACVGWLWRDGHKAAEPADPERGSAVLEAVIGAPAVILLLVTLIGAGRVANAHQVVDDAAGDAARAASAARTTTAAGVAARHTASASLSGRGVSCSPMAVSVDTSRWRPGGAVGVTLTCTAQLADLGVPILGGSRTVVARAASVIDVYRQLGP